MPRSRLLIIAGVVIVAAIAIGGFYVYDQVLRGDNVAALSLPSAAPSAAAASGTTATSPSSDPTAAASTGAAASVASVGTGDTAGTWTVATGSQAGYRVTEQLANLPAQSDAVGRTDKVTGTITLTTSGSTTTLTAADLTVDTTSISSDKSQRDNRLRTEGLQTDTYPTATFKLTQPVAVPAAALAGTPSDVTLTGDLTLHGVTKSVQIPAKAQLVNGMVSVAGALSFPLSDFGMTAPNIGGFIVSIADHGTLEFVVNFTKA
jgi:polyisoprenoid-binding protein YceI